VSRATPSPATDRNLLFGVLCLQAALIDPTQFVEACTAWTARKDTPLADLLLERGWLTAEDRVHLDYLLERKLSKHDGDARASLATVADHGARRLLAGLNDPDVAQSLAGPDGHALPSTVPYEPEARERYTLTRLHAQGGIGRVWLARDEALGREVALKELRPDRADHPAAAGRFLEEARITGQLQHPGIVPVYELGRQPDTRQPFYTMRFVQGRTLAEAARTYHARREKGEAGPLELRELLGAFVGACNAVAYAHSRGVLHRDLKPANVVHGDFGEVMVLDWGLGKVVGRPDDEAAPVMPDEDGPRAGTAQGAVLGTPAYMAPEQAEGRLDLLDRRTDVYGLGAILYEVLTGRPPFDGPGTAEVLRQVCTEEPVPPRRLVTEVPPALEAVCRRALAKQRADRYATAGDLAEEVRRFLADEPVAAYPESVVQRLGRWGRRHRTAVAGAAALLVTAVVGLAAGLWAVNAERQRTRQALAGEQQARADEAKRRRQAREALDAMSSEIIDDWLAKQKELTEPQKQFLEQALASYEEFARDTGQDQEARAGVAAAYGRVGNIRWRLGQLAPAEDAYRQAQERYARLAADFPDVPDYRRHLAAGDNNLGNLLRETGRPREAEGEYRTALALRQKLADDFPAAPDARQDLAASHNNLGLLLQDTGQVPEAEDEFRAALDLEQRLAGDHPDVADFRHYLAGTHNNLGVLLHQAGQLPAAEKEYRAALALKQRLADMYPAVAVYRQELVRSHYNLGHLLGDSRRPREAEAEYRAAVAVAGRLAADYPAVPDYRQELARGHYNLGTLLDSTRRGKEAETEYRAALAVQQRLADDFPAVPAYRMDLARSASSLGSVLRGTGHAAEAEAAFRRALPLYQKLADDHPTVADYRQGLAGCHYDLGLLALASGRGPEAEAEFRRALPLYEKLADDRPTVPDARRSVALIHNNLGALAQRAGNGRAADGEFQEALAVRRRLAHDFPAVADYQNDLAGSLVNLAVLAHGRGDVAATRHLLEEAVPHHEAALKANPRSPLYRAFFRNNSRALADTCLHLGDHAAAAAAADRLAGVGVDPPHDLYDAAGFLARCAQLAAKDDKLPAARRQELAKAHADRALAALRQAVARGYKDVAHLKKDPDLDPLRDRADFRRLLADLEKPKPAGK
jgi:tetratricopeptide (TPR) repeat protein/tRNA A-37 threonylcarbamoyl transferase component Bud32